MVISGNTLMLKVQTCLEKSTESMIECADRMSMHGNRIEKIDKNGNDIFPLCADKES